MLTRKKKTLRLLPTGRERTDGPKPSAKGVIVPSVVHRVRAAPSLRAPLGDRSENFQATRKRALAFDPPLRSLHGRTACQGSGASGADRKGRERDLLDRRARV